MTDRLCYYCKYFYLDTASWGYSEYTPGENWEMGCWKEVWEYDQFTGNLAEFRACIEAAKTCDKFEERA